jgi:predicted Zn-dependent peptidase
MTHNGFPVTPLVNGVRALTAPRAGDTMCVMLFVTAGSRFESRENSGAAHMLEHLFFSGTARRPSLRMIAAEIDSWGCRFNALTDKEYTAYYIHGAAGNVEAALELIADLMHNAVLPPDDIERERKVIFAELRSRQDNLRQISRQLANRALYGDEPMGWETVGFTDVLSTLDRDQLMEFRHALYRGSRMIVSVAGPTPHDRLAALTERHFGTVPAAPDGPAVPAPASYAAPVNVSVPRDSRLAHLWLVGPGPTYADPEREMMAVRLMNAVFGSSMSSRLFTSVREDQGLCYSIRSTLDPCSDVGAFLVATAVAPDKAPQVVSSVTDEMARLAASGPTDAELAKARAIVKGTSALDREDAAALARFSAFELMHRGFVRTRAERDDLANSVTRDEVVEVTRRYLDPAGLRCAVAGPAEVVPRLVDAGCLASPQWTEG